MSLVRVGVFFAVVFHYRPWLSLSFATVRHLRPASPAGSVVLASVVLHHHPPAIPLEEMPPRRGNKPSWAYDAHMKAKKFQNRQPQQIPTPVFPPFLPGNPPPINPPTTWPRFEIFAKPMPLRNGFHELVYMQVPEMIVLASMPIPYADWLKPAFVEAWERSNAIMRHRYGDRLPIWMRRKSRCQRLLEMVPYGARTEVIANIGGLIAIGALVVFIFIMWEVRNMSVANCKKLCLA